MFTTRGFYRIIVKITLLSSATLFVVNVEDHAPQADFASSCYKRTPGQNMTLDDVVDISTNNEASNKVKFNEKEAKDLNSFAAENAVEDEVPKDTVLEEDVLSDATSFDGITISYLIVLVITNLMVMI
ncbi:hypothetical protein ACOSQ2_021028 [Xanthoceras sorbifolium]